MTETIEKALAVLDVLYTERHIEEAEYTALKDVILKGPPFGDSGMKYTAFLIDGGFGDFEDVSVDAIRLDEVDSAELEVLLRVAMRQDLDFVIRKCEEEDGDG